MKKILPVLFGVVALAIAGVLGVVFLVPKLFAREKTVMSHASAATAAPGGCTPEAQRAGVEAAMASTAQGASVGGFYGAAAGAGIGITKIATGPCAPGIEKKLREMAAAGVKGAVRALNGFDDRRLKAQGQVWDVATAGAARRAGVKQIEATKSAAKSAVSKAGKGVSKTTSKAKKKAKRWSRGKF